METTDLHGFDLSQDPQDIIASALQEAGRTHGFARPTTFDPSVCYQHLADALSEHCLDGAKIGFEASAVSISDFPVLKRKLGDVELIDASEVLAKLKMVKSTGEIENLRKAVEIAESGIRAVQEAIAPAVTRQQLAGTWNAAIAQHQDHATLSGAWEYISVGPDPWSGNASAQAGDLIKVDVGCLVNGYTSDTGRTYVLGPPEDFQARLHDLSLIHI